MEEKLEWKKGSSKNELVKNLEAIVNGVVMNELNSINSKVEMLVQMGMIQDGPQIQQLREKMKQLRTGTPNAT